MSLLVAEHLKRHFGAQDVLIDADLRIERGDKIGVVGRNGGGKSTLLRIIEGEETPDGGTLTIAKRTTLGYVHQRPSFGPGVTVRQYVESGLDEVHRIGRELDRIGEAMGEADGDALDRLVREHGELSERMAFLGGWDAERRIETVLSGIGLAEEFWDREADTLSGGEKSRTALARELVAVPDLLLLDEPTNHLDLQGIEWLEDYLHDLQSAVLIVSHDRRLLSRAVDVIAELEFGRLTRYPGHYAKYLNLKAERYEVAYREWKKQDDLIRREESFIKKHMGSQRTAEAKGRQKKLSHIKRLSKPFHDVRRPVIRPPEASRGGELVLEAEGLCVGYDERVILDHVDLRIGRGERIGIVGRNGAGKSTLLRILAGIAAPDSGEVKRGHKAECGYYDQDTSELREDGTPFTEIRRDHPELTDGQIRDHLAKFLFRGNDIDSVVSSLSGGERARLVLARLVLRKPSWLALDEPTNHLDLAARTSLEEMLGAFGGAIVVVSHDREFLDGICNTIFNVEDGKVERFDGNYSAWHAKRDADRAEASAEAARATAAKKEAQRKQDEAERAKAARPSKGKRNNKKSGRPRNPYLFKKLEAAIISLEEERESLQNELVDETVYKDPDAMRERQYRLAEIERDLDDKNREWEEWV